MLLQITGPSHENTYLAKTNTDLRHNLNIKAYLSGDNSPMWLCSYSHLHYCPILLNSARENEKYLSEWGEVPIHAGVKTVSCEVTFSGRGQGRRPGLRVAEEHLLVQAAKSVVRWVRVLLDEDVTGRNDVHYDHLHCDSTGQQQLGDMTRRVKRSN